MTLPRDAHLLPTGQSLETVRLPTMTVHLLAHGDGSEVMRQDLQPGVLVGMRPEDGWTALEMMYVLSGRLRLKGEDVDLTAGDSISAQPVRAPILLEVLEPSSVLYICSQPVFSAYSQDIAALFELATEVEMKDGYTKEHCQRIQSLSLAVGEALHLPPDRMYALAYGSFLHDLGKVHIPDNVLGKPSPLNPEEWAIMRRHPELGAEMLSQRAYLKVAAPILLQHHERLDGSGYPRGLSGGEILLESRIVAIVDAYDAMTSNRPYRAAPGHDYAVRELRANAGTHFDADIVETFVGTLEGTMTGTKNSH